MTRKLLVSNQLEFNHETVEIIKKTVAVGATDTELQMFLYQAQKSGLDPLARQIYFIKRGGKVTIQASIDGLRLVAQRNGNYAGQDEPIFEDGTSYPKIAKVSVYKFSPKGERYIAAVGVAYWSEYCPLEGQNFMWKKMPHTMLAKVAEALALRKAFPQELSGIYTGEEMEQSAEATPLNETFTDNRGELTPEEKEDLERVPLEEDMAPDQDACNCGTKGKYHGKDCPLYKPLK